MHERQDVACLFELAIKAELVARDLYRQLAQKFSSHSEVVSFWEELARQEIDHAGALQRIYAKLTPEQRAAPADPVKLAGIRSVLAEPLARLLEDITNLEEAYRLASDLENSEVNAVFEFLINCFSTDPQVGDFLRAQLQEHLAFLMRDFPQRFGPAGQRRLIEATA